jgi:hypothetical protein
MFAAYQHKQKMSYSIQRKSDGLFYKCRQNSQEVWTQEPTGHDVKSPAVYIAQLFSTLYKLTQLKH